MKVNKAELSKKIDRVKSIVPKSSPTQALLGVLVKDGYLIASNTEMTVKAKLEGAEGESFIIPSRAFDLIKNLPDGEIDITEDRNNTITISMEKIKNSYQSLPASDFSFTADRVADGGGATLIDSKVMKEAIAHVLYAIPNKGINNIMTSLYMQASGGNLNFVGLDGHVIAWVQVEFDGEFELLIPRGAVEKLLSLEMAGDISIEYDSHSAIFHSEEYEVHTRLVEGKYFSYDKFFKDCLVNTSVNRSDLLEAVVRAKLCTEELTPTRFDIEGTELNLSIKDKSSNYSEMVSLQSPVEQKMVIGFNSRLVLETLKAHTGKVIELGLDGSKQPMIVKSEAMQSIVLPVQIHA